MGVAYAVWPVSEPEPEPGSRRRRVAGYELEAVVGHGSTSTVYRARKGKGNRSQLVALKRLRRSNDPDLVRRLREEAGILAGLEHPNIVRVLGVGADGEGTAMAMQYAAGGSLATLLAHRGRLRPEEAVAVAVPLADALVATHRQGLVHGDVKPANILFTSSGAPVLADFGLAGQHAGDTAVMGTAGYVDPAVLQGARADERSDVYGLGAVCHEMLVGRPPGLHAGASRKLLGPPALAVVVERSLARRPSDRFPDAAAMASALRAAAAELPVAPLLPPLVPAADSAATDRPSTDHPATDRPATDRPATDLAGSGPDVAGPPTRPVGTPPTRPASRSASGQRRPRHRRVMIVGAVLVAVGAFLGVTAVGLGLLIPGLVGPPDRPRAVACAPLSAPMQADIDGDGCPSAVTWSANVLEVEGRRYQLGQPGDALLLGDWDCDGRDTPALYRPGGTVFFFDAWAEDGQALPAASRGDHVMDGAPEVHHGKDGCDRLVVR